MYAVIDSKNPTRFYMVKQISYLSGCVTSHNTGFGSERADACRKSLHKSFATILLYVAEFTTKPRPGNTYLHLVPLHYKACTKRDAERENAPHWTTVAKKKIRMVCEASALRRLNLGFLSIYHISLWKPRNFGIRAEVGRSGVGVLL